MTTQALHLRNRLVPWAPIAIQRKDGSRYISADWDEIGSLIDAACVEGIGPQSGRIRYLRCLYEETEAITRMAAAMKKTAESAGSIISGASQTAYRQHLETGHTCWTLHNLQDGWNRQSLSVFCGPFLRPAAREVSLETQAV